ncbi:MAG: FGGY-family carbohydrate kinase [Lachnospiraceae bacterium]|nr:FGGY-family carbohydrate kinase [Lachnospiraceae bacterium]
MAEYIMGIDCGTGSVRAALFDFRGQNRAYEIAEYGTTYPKNGWAEQDDNEWLAALQKAIKGCITKAGIANDNILAITCDATTNTLVYLGEDDKSVRKPILWMDVRAAGEAAEIDEIRDQYDATKFYKPSFRADTMIPKCMWVKRHEPENWAKTKTIMEFEDWLNWKLTGKKTLSMSIAAFRWNYDDKNGGHPVDLMNACGIGDALDKFPKDVLKVGEVIGTVSLEAAEFFGLSTKTKVIEGTADCNACMFGVGGVRPGGMTLIGGTSTCLLGLSETEFHVDGVNGTYPNCMYDGTSLLEGGQTAAGSVLTWFRNNLIPGSWVQEAIQNDKNIYDLIGEKAATAEVGAGGVVMFSDFQGNRAPYSDSKARGIFVGLSVGTTPEQMARAVFEGIAYGANNCIVAMNKGGYPVKEIYACGGIATNPYWLQMHSDIIGVPIYTTVENQSAGCLGDAIIAAVGAGVYKDFGEAADSMVRFDKEYHPDMKKHEEYQFYMDRYMEIWPSLRETVHKLVDHNN